MPGSFAIHRGEFCQASPEPAEGTFARFAACGGQYVVTMMFHSDAGQPIAHGSRTPGDYPCGEVAPTWVSPPLRHLDRKSVP
jgi:hypothetical protein